MARTLVNPISRKTIFPLIKKLFNISCRGLERISPRKNYILAMNHQSALDILVAPALLVPHTNRHLSIFVHKNIYYMFYPLFKRWKAIKTDHRTVETRSLAIEEGVKLLHKGHNVLIFPEAAVDGAPYDKMLRAFTGVIRLAIKSRTTIIPVGIKGSYRAWKFPHTTLRHPLNPFSPWNPLSFFYFNFSHPVQVAFGKEISLERYYSINLEQKTEENKKLLRKLVTELMVKIGKLAGQTYKHDTPLIR